MDIAVRPRRRSKTSLPALVAATRGNCLVRVRLPYRRSRERPAVLGRCVFSLVDYRGTEIRCRWPTGCAKRSWRERGKSGGRVARVDGGTGGWRCDCGQGSLIPTTAGLRAPSRCSTEPNARKCTRDSTYQRMKKGAQVKSRRDPDSALRHRLSAHEMGSVRRRASASPRADPTASRLQTSAG